MIGDLLLDPISASPGTERTQDNTSIFIGFLNKLEGWKTNIGQHLRKTYMCI